MIHCIAIDDEPRALEVIRHHVSRVDFLELSATFVDPFRAMAYLAEAPVDLVFLDINMPDISGLDWLRRARRRPLVIFTTAHSEYAVASYELEAVDYLLKPFDFPRFLQAVSRAKDRLHKAEPARADFFFVNTGQHQRRLSFRDIYCVEGEGNYVRYHTSSGAVLVRASLRETLAQLPDPSFAQIHRSFIVSIPWIERIADNHVQLPDRRIPISSSYREAFLRRIEGFGRG